MYWKLTTLTRQEPTGNAADAQRFVLHRHKDASGIHHDLRLEEGNFLLGFRIAGDSFETGCWATEKMPHPKEWLQQDRDAQRILAGTYRRHTLDQDHHEITLHSQDETVTLHFERCDTPAVESIRDLAACAQKHNLPMDTLTARIEDGLAARRNSIARFCSLSRELDGKNFAENTWRDLFDGMELRQVDEQLAGVEARYDRAHPPCPVSHPETLEPKEDTRQNRAQRARRILNQ
ncbi:MAG: hypothetical protein KAH38_08900 [Candidatus Hydrogenedentes bacterium]|nr:hypothetical protein [Candidatus Hydrogenedentota bacterium]